MLWRRDNRDWLCRLPPRIELWLLDLDVVDLVTHSQTGEQRTQLGYADANAAGWFNGPPYAVAETVIDEDALEACVKLVGGTQPSACHRCV